MRVQSRVESAEPTRSALDGFRAAAPLPRRSRGNHASGHTGTRTPHQVDPRRRGTEHAGGRRGEAPEGVRSTEGGVSRQAERPKPRESGSRTPRTRTGREEAPQAGASTPRSRTDARTAASGGRAAGPTRAKRRRADRAQQGAATRSEAQGARDRPCQLARRSEAQERTQASEAQAAPQRGAEGDSPQPGDAWPDSREDRSGAKRRRGPQHTACFCLHCPRAQVSMEGGAAQTRRWTRTGAAIFAGSIRTRSGVRCKTAGTERRG